MSCYICDNETISVLARAFKEYGVRFRNNEGFYLDSVADIGQALLKQNYASYDYRYAEQNEVPKFKPNYKIEYDEGDVVGCIGCYFYQSCETDDWDGSNIHRSLEKLQYAVLEYLVKRCGMKMPWGYGNYLD